MGKITKFLTSVSLVVAMATGAASAADCSITNTGPNSNNQCSSSTTNTSKTVCVNNTLVSNNSSQSSSSGSSNVSGNTTGGSATSGSSNNSNVTNTSANGSCAKGTTPVPAGSPAAQAAAAGKGGLQFDKQGNLIGTSLPSTGANDTVKAAAFAVAGVAAAVAVGQAGLGVYRRKALSL